MELHARTVIPTVNQLQSDAAAVFEHFRMLTLIQLDHMSAFRRSPCLRIYSLHLTDIGHLFSADLLAGRRMPPEVPATMYPAMMAGHRISNSYLPFPFPFPLADVDFRR
jgi:hypothetical protein